MKKLINVQNAVELLGRLYDGKRVEGVLFIDEETGGLTFKAWNRKPREREQDVLLKKLPWGWVKESQMRIKVHASLPKDLGTACMMSELDRNTREAKNVMIDRELIEFC